MTKTRISILAAAVCAVAVTVFAQTFPTTETFRLSDSVSDIRRKLNQSGVTVAQLTSIGTNFAVAVPVAKGGTGATTPAAARSNLGIAETATNSVIPILKGGTGATNAARAQINLGIAAGSAATAAGGTATITFDPVYAAAPFVVVTPVAVTPGTNFVSVTESNFVWTCNESGVTFNWIAVGQ